LYLTGNRGREAGSRRRSEFLSRIPHPHNGFRHIDQPAAKHNFLTFYKQSIILSVIAAQAGEVSYAGLPAGIYFVTLDSRDSKSAVRMAVVH
jgi:hypothetical protein